MKENKKNNYYKPKKFFILMDYEDEFQPLYIDTFKNYDEIVEFLKEKKGIDTTKDNLKTNINKGYLLGGIYTVIKDN